VTPKEKGMSEAAAEWLRRNKFRETGYMHWVRTLGGATIIITVGEWKKGRPLYFGSIGFSRKDSNALGQGVTGSNTPKLAYRKAWDACGHLSGVTWHNQHHNVMRWMADKDGT
jgi:hypothetical protein